MVEVITATQELLPAIAASVPATRQQITQRARQIIREVTGFATKDAEEALRIMEISAKGSKCQKPVYSAKINPEGDRIWNKDEIRRAVELLEDNLGLKGHQRVVIEHKKHGRIHFHVLWSRFPPEGGAAVRMSNNYAIHKKTQSQIEQEFELRPMRTKGRDFKHSEVEWAKRYGFDIFKLREQITAAFNSAKCGQAFNVSLKEQGIVLCRGDKSQFVLILPWGQHKALSSMIHGRPTKAVLRRSFADIDIKDMPTVAEGKAIVRATLPKAQSNPKSGARGKSSDTLYKASTSTYKGSKSSVVALWQAAQRQITSGRPKISSIPVPSAAPIRQVTETPSPLPQQATPSFAKPNIERDIMPRLPEEIGGDEASSGRADIAYKEEFDKWAGLIESAGNDPSVSKDQRLANVRALRIQQQAAAQAASRQASDEEKATANARRRARKKLVRKTKLGPAIS